MARICDEKCNECKLLTEKNARMLTAIFNALYKQLGNRVYETVQAHCPCMTTCYDCRMDDFVHSEDCDLLG